MKSSSPPKKTLQDFFSDFVHKMKESNEKQLYKGLNGLLINEENKYKSLCMSNRLGLYSSGLYLSKTSKIKEVHFLKLYEKFQRSKTTEHVRLEILKTLSKSKCMFCEKRSGNDTLDHFLPKGQYPYLVVTPTNLISSCSICNSKKRISGSVSFHPYFTDINNLSFILCDVKIKVINKKYELLTEYSFDNNTKVRVKNNISKDLKQIFTSLNLKIRYSEYCAEYIDEKLYDWLVIASNSQNELLEMLKRELQSLQRQYSQNSFLIPFYTCFIEKMETPTFYSDFKKIRYGDVV